MLWQSFHGLVITQWVAHVTMQQVKGQGRILRTYQDII